MKRILLGFLIVLAAMSFAEAQSMQKLVLEFVSGNDLTVVGADQTVLKLGAGIFEGDDIPVGATISTGPTTTAELRLTPNGSIIKLARATTFSVTSLASQPQEKNAFGLVAGKVRAVAAKGGQYELRTQTAVCGVRGTDFAFSVEPGAKALLAVAKGLVEFEKLDPSGAVIGAIPVGAGQAADAFAESFAAFAFSAEQFAQEFTDAAFEKLADTEVNQDTEPTTTETPAESAPAGTPPEGTTVTEPVTAAEAASTLAEGTSKLTKSEVESGFAKWLREALGMELGSVTINETTYAKAVIQPNLKLGKLKMGLYLPIIYSSNLFDPTDWYHPSGNDEWSFGYGLWESDPIEAAKDAAKDLALKIKYVEYGRQLEDPFFFKVGNLDDLTIGHGLIMKNYANDTEFPAVRRVGFNLGVDTQGVGFEALVNDLADPEILGARVFIHPIANSKFAVGFSAVADLFAASDLYTEGAAGTAASDIGDPILLAAGIDLDFPILSGPFGLRLFADGAAAVPYTRTVIKDTTIEPGLQYQLVYDDGKIQNWGAAAGFIGRVLFIDWRLEYRYYTGIFTPALFDSSYDKNRVYYATQYANYLKDPSTYGTDPTVMGIYGEGGFSLLRDKLSLTFGYAWPWSPDASLSEQLTLSSDELHVALVIQKGLIPIIDVSGAIYYDRRGLAAAIADNNVKLIDEKTTFGGELVVPVPKTPNLDIAVVFATVAKRDNGVIQWADDDPSQGIPELMPSITIETRFHF